MRDVGGSIAPVFYHSSQAPFPLSPHPPLREEESAKTERKERANQSCHIIPLPIFTST
jgi:hypothetical protein